MIEGGFVGGKFVRRRFVFRRSFMSGRIAFIRSFVDIHFRNIIKFEFGAFE